MGGRFTHGSLRSPWAMIHHPAKPGSGDDTFVHLGRVPQSLLQIGVSHLKERSSAALVTGHLLLVTPQFLPDSSPCLAGLFPSTLLGKSPARVDEESGTHWEQGWTIWTQWTIWTRTQTPVIDSLLLLSSVLKKENSAVLCVLCGLLSGGMVGHRIV